MLSDDLDEKKIIAKRPEFWHEGFVSSEKHCSEVFFAGLLFLFENSSMQKTWLFLATSLSSRVC